MNFEKSKLIPVVLPVLLIFLFIYWSKLKQFVKHIESYWFYKRNFVGKLSTFFFVLSFISLSLAFLDPKGPAKKIQSSIPDQKTVILIDMSASMMVEDVRPNRLERAITIARHFVKKAFGHQVSIMIFSDTTKKLIPFTDDLDLLDARLTGLSKMNLRGGSSKISTAILESIQLLKSESSSSGEVFGNVLLLTDAEENGAQLDIPMQNSVPLAVIGIGTASGGAIPIKGANGSFINYKRHNGKEVVSKLDEEYLKKIGKRFQKFKYWVSLSYNLPTEAVLEFFKGEFKKKLEKGTITIKPAYAKYFILSFIFFQTISILLGQFRTFKIAGLLLFMGMGEDTELLANTTEQIEKKEVKIEELPYYEKNLAGEATLAEKQAFAESMIENKLYEKAIVKIDEIKDFKNTSKLEFNQATALLFSGEIQKGLEQYAKIRASLSSDLRKKMDANVQLALNSEGKGKDKSKNQDKNKENKKQDKDGKKDQDKNDRDQKNKDQKDKKDGQQGKDQNKQDKNKQNKSGNDRKQEDKKKNDQKDKKDKEKKDEKNDESKSKEKSKAKKKTLEEKENEIRKKKKMIKIPAVLKQLLQDDRGLQKEYIDTTTNEKGYGREKKDW